MKFKEFEYFFCETCQKELKSKKAHDECFHANHTIRHKGQFVLSDTTVQNILKGGKNGK